uniref:Uncharacterized protein n=1 Tax=Meloidogyne enterolobii TaxID=390850 RepID=A0A6V7WDB7_MELEN|nr:unnamed protein product [Meloidogyne enterolobii]
MQCAQLDEEMTRKGSIFEVKEEQKREKERREEQQRREEEQRREEGRREEWKREEEKMEELRREEERREEQRKEEQRREELRREEETRREDQQKLPSPPDMSGLSLEEQNKILEVMRAAEEHDRIVEERQKSIDILKLKEKEEDLAKRQIEWENKIEEIVDVNTTLQPSLSFLEDLSKYGQPILPSPTTLHQQINDLPSSETPPKISQIEDDEKEEEEDLWMQPPRQEFIAPPEAWENVVVNSSAKKLWTTDFTEEFIDNVNEEMKKSSGMEINDEGEIIGEDEISVDTVRGCWETAPKNAEAILHFKEQLSKQQFSDQQEKSPMSTVAEVEEEMAAIARSIYTSSFVPTTEGQEMREDENTVQLADIGDKRLQKSDSGGGYFEVEMEDPWSPTSPTFNPSSKSISSFTQQQRPQQIHPPPTITVTEEKKPTEEESEEEGEDGGGEVVSSDVKRSRVYSQPRPGSSSSEEGDEDDYPDQVIKAPTISPASIAAFQEENETEKQKLAAEVLQQIQSFGEAADDEFDVKWAKPAQQLKARKGK